MLLALIITLVVIRVTREDLSGSTRWPPRRLPGHSRGTGPAAPRSAWASRGPCRLRRTTRRPVRTRLWRFCQLNGAR
jgi:hypothetical protein